MKFAHLADCHIGGWSDLKLKELNMKVFSKSIQECINRDVDFVLIAGDLFNTALPSIDLIKETVLHLKKLKDSEIPCYIIPGSHDYSPSGKTMLDVFENAGLVINVVKFNDNKLEFTEDKSGVKITGLFGKKAGLEKGYYELLDRNAGDDMEIVELSEILAVGLGLKVRREEKEEYIDGEERVINDTQANINIERELKDEDYYEGNDGRDK